MRILVNHDGQQLGPYSLEEVRAAVQAGSLNVTDLAWVEGTPSWVTLSSILDAPAGGLPAFAGATPQYSSQAYAAQTGETSGLAITSLVLGILSWFCFFIFASIPAVICGHIARSNIRNSQGRLKGEGIALGGLICGYLNIALVPLFIVLAIPGFNTAREKSLEVRTMNDARQISTACMQYAGDHNGKYPDSLDDLAANEPALRSVLQRPGTAGFDYFGRGKTESRIEQPSTTPIVAGRKANPQGKRVIGYADGHASIDVLPTDMVGH
jgi:hypothetical protein